jgi:hypothetical protein
MKVENMNNYPNIYQLLNGAKNLLIIANERLGGNSVIEDAFHNVDSAIQELPEDNLHAMIDYYLTLESLFGDDDEWIEQPNLNEYP